MNKTELINAVAEKTGLSKKDSDKAVNAVVDSIIEAMKAGEKVTIIGFGAFEAKERAARVGRNPASGAEIQIPATRVPQFKAGRVLKDIISQ